MARPEDDLTSAEAGTRPASDVVAFPSFPQPRAGAGSL